MGSGRGDPVHSIVPGGRRLRAGPLVEPGAVRVRALPGVRRAAAGDATLPGVHGHRVRHHEGPGHGSGAVGATRGERSGPAAALEGGRLHFFKIAERSKKLAALTVSFDRCKHATLNSIKSEPESNLIKKS